MKRNNPDFLINTIGMPEPHKAAFLTVAAQQRCVIIVRATGPTCHGPLSEGYDTKGYRIHGKSCDWGPMAGFVMRDPRLNKYGLGKAKFNRSKHKEALRDDHEGQGWLAATTPLKISLARVHWLTQRGLIKVTAGKTSEPLKYAEWMRDTNNGALAIRSDALKSVDKALQRYEQSSNVSNFEELKRAGDVLFATMGPRWSQDARNRKGSLNQLWSLIKENRDRNFALDRLDGTATHPSGISFRYSLIKEGNVYGVYFDKTRPDDAWEQEGVILKMDAATFPHGFQYEPMMAMTNPPGHRLRPGEHYLNAITGDYDLFAVWAFVKGDKKYDAGAYGDDHRPLGTVKGSVGQAERQNADRLERHFALKPPNAAAPRPRVEDNFVGTKLGNITPRIYMVCQMINSIVGRHVLWHSDEAARPYLDDMDLPVIAFTPAGNYIGIETVADMKQLIRVAEQAGIRVTLSNAWTQDPTAEVTKRLGADYARYVPADGERIIVPSWYND